MRNIDADALRGLNAVEAFVIADFNLLSVNDDDAPCNLSDAVPAFSVLITRPVPAPARSPRSRRDWCV